MIKCKIITVFLRLNNIKSEIGSLFSLSHQIVDRTFFVAFVDSSMHDNYLTLFVLGYSSKYFHWRRLAQHA